MKKIFPLVLTLLFSTPSLTASAHEGSWFSLGGSYEYLSSGRSVEGPAVNMEGGYWYLGNVAVGGHFKAASLGKNEVLSVKNTRVYDIGAFWKIASEQGFYGKLVTGLAFASGDTSGLDAGQGRSFYLGLGGGFLFDVSDSFQIGPEVLYRHWTARNGSDQVSVGALVAYRF
jgi:hypothetical protein